MRDWMNGKAGHTFENNRKPRDMVEGFRIDDG